MSEVPEFREHAEIHFYSQDSCAVVTRGADEESDSMRFGELYLLTEFAIRTFWKMGHNQAALKIARSLRHGLDANYDLSLSDPAQVVQSSQQGLPRLLDYRGPAAQQFLCEATYREGRVTSSIQSNGFGFFASFSWNHDQCVAYALSAWRRKISRAPGDIELTGIALAQVATNHLMNQIGPGGHFQMAMDIARATWDLQGESVSDSAS